MMRILIAAALAFSLAACGPKPVVSVPPASCAKMVPGGWRDGVEAAPVPANAPVGDWLGKPLTAAIAAALVAPWAGAYVAMSGALEKANGRTADTIGIVTTCEAMVNEARPN